jgi:transcriptional regulator with XRE-family HTH domain
VTFCSDFGQILRGKRKGVLKTLEQAAEEVGVCAKRLGQIEQGRVIPNPDVVCQIGKALGDKVILHTYCKEICPIGMCLGMCGAVDAEIIEQIKVKLKEINELPSIASIRIADPAQPQPYEKERTAVAAAV